MSLDWDDEMLRMFGGVVDTNKPPRTYTYQSENFCPICNSPKTYIEKVKLKKYMEKEIKSFQYLLNHIKENNLNAFTINDLIQSMNISHLTDGGLQRKILSVLVVLGYFRREIEEFENKDKKKGIRYLFFKNAIVTQPACYDTIKDVHKKVEWKKTSYFDSKNKGKDNDTNTTTTTRD